MNGMEGRAKGHEFVRTYVRNKSLHMTLNVLMHCNRQRVELFMRVHGRNCLRNWVHNEGRHRAAGKAHYPSTGHVMNFSYNGWLNVAEKGGVDVHSP